MRKRWQFLIMRLVIELIICLYEILKDKKKMFTQTIKKGFDLYH